MDSIFDLSGNPELRTLLSEKMRRQQFNISKFGKWMGPNWVKNGGGSQAEEVVNLGPMGPRWTGAPIETVDAFIQEGRTDMLIPVRSVLDELPIYGDMSLWGKEEVMKFAFREVVINRMRKGYAPPTGMNRQKIKQWAKQQIVSASNQLMEWWYNYFPHMILSAIYNGASPEVIAPLANGGIGKARVSHPNFFTAGAGKVSYAGGRPGTAGYEASVEAALNGLTNVASDHMTPDFIGNLVAEAPRHKIKPIITKDGFEFYPIWLRDAQWQQLRKHADFKELAMSLTVTGLDKSPLGNGAVCFLHGAVIYVDLMMWCGYTNADNGDVTAGTVEYGPRPSAAERAAGHYTGKTISTPDTGNKAGCILVGQSMLSVATGEDMQMVDEDQDYGNRKGVALDQIRSIVRNENYDRLGLIPGLSAGDFYENPASLVGFTFSPHALAYS